MSLEHGITVGIAAFNARKTLERALDSALLQMPPAPFEVLVIDDGSTDTTANIALAYELRFPKRVRLIRTVNCGVAAARNVIVANARYDHLTWLDSDDHYGPEKLARQYDALALGHMLNRTKMGDPYLMVFSGFYLDADTYEFSRFIADPIPPILRGEFRAYLWASMTATRAYRDVGPFNEELHRLEDTDWLLRYLKSGARQLIATGQDPLMQYYFSTQRDGQKVEEAFRFMLRQYGEDMRLTGVMDEYVPRRWREISSFYHSNRKWNEMWRCRAMAAKHDHARYGGILEKELSELSMAQQPRIRALCEAVIAG